MASYTSRLFVRLHLMSKRMVAEGFANQKVYIETKDRRALLEIYSTLRKYSNQDNPMTWGQLKSLLDRKLNGNKFDFV
ncbi:DUF1031 family protein [Lactococcus garvieae]|uniref:DUF1031 family protein n=1 Tax=Lactococcus garvieae TaxID=1363 RepID=UPI0013FD28A5|nr:DUF1031 family protein [Lactococcus garvieae]NHI70079.1 DUF1031 domain-containing protein [Lactococcus garvieae]NHJ08095.1 DUF1031 domain-containing protein [Lactococcus garvieae]